jgi:TetR/AcrR family transcriptional regulator, ethionamide resistance regulator
VDPDANAPVSRSATAEDGAGSGRFESRSEVRAAGAAKVVSPRRTQGATSADFSPTLAQIGRAAHEQIRLNGYSNLTVDAVIKEAGVSRATFYFYFQNKKHLLTHLAASVMDELYDVAGLHYPEQDEFNRIVLANIAYLDVWRRETVVLGEFFALSLVDPEIAESYRSYRDKFELRIMGRIERLLSLGRIPDANPRVLASTLSSMVEFSAFRHFVADDAIGHSNVTFGELVLRLSEAWYRAVYGRTPETNLTADAIEQLAREWRTSRLEAQSAGK